MKVTKENLRKLIKETLIKNEKHFLAYNKSDRKIQEGMLSSIKTEFKTPIKSKDVLIDYKTSDEIGGIDWISIGEFLNVHWTLEAETKTYGMNFYPSIKNITGFFHVERRIDENGETEEEEIEINIPLENIETEIEGKERNYFSIYPTEIEIDYITKKAIVKF